MQSFTATYSPDDNKLRLEASNRLGEELYARVKAAGFRWAPKLEQFICPAWNPAAEDLCLELAGEIEDDDRTLTERAEERAERFEGYSERREAEAERAREAVHAIADGIPMGQPILVGHHSERHARRDAEKIERGMRKAVDLWKTSKYWEQRAAGAIAHAKYKELPAVRARRIKTLEAEQRKVQRSRDEEALWLRLWADVGNPDSLKRKDGQPTTAHERAVYLANRCHLGVAKNERGSYWTAWDVLRPDGERHEACPAMTVEQVQAVAAKAYPRSIAHCDRWLTHLANRLTYERAMLQESGYKAPPKPATKGSLPLLNYGGAVSYRNPYTGAVITSEATGITKAELAAIGTDYKGTRVSACGTHRVRTAMHIPGHGRDLCIVYLTDSKKHDRPTADVVAARAAEEHEALQERLAERTRRAEQQAKARAEALAAQSDREAKDAAFRALQDAQRAGVQVVSAPQLFPTPSELAERMVGLAELEPGMRVLEPSAGTGRIVAAINAAAACEVVTVEINVNLADGLRRLTGRSVFAADFLRCNGDLGTFDRVVMNPPFERGSDVQHIEHAIKFLRPGGVLVALCANGPRQRAALQERADYWEDLPAGSFAAAGTGVNVAMLRITRNQ